MKNGLFHLCWRMLSSSRYKPSIVCPLLKDVQSYFGFKYKPDSMIKLPSNQNKLFCKAKNQEHRAYNSGQTIMQISLTFQWRVNVLNNSLRISLALIHISSHLNKTLHSEESLNPHMTFLTCDYNGGCLGDLRLRRMEPANTPTWYIVLCHTPYVKGCTHFVTLFTPLFLRKII